MRKPFRFLPYMIAIGVAACGAPTQPYSQPAPAPSASVNATPTIAFTPSQVSIVAGGTVTFAFGNVGHNVFFDGAPAGAPANIDGVNANSEVTRTFPVAGVYSYSCHIHPGMHGTIVVGSQADTTVVRDTTGYTGYGARYRGP